MLFKLEVIKRMLFLRALRVIYKNDLAGLRAKRWRKLRRVLLQSPYYHDLAAAHTPHADYPLMDKSSFMANFSKINTQGIDRNAAFDLAIEAEKSRDFTPMINGVTIGLSSGTSGNRGVFLATEAERAQWVSCVLDRIIGFSLQKRSVAFFLRANSNLYDSVKSKVLSFEFFDLLEPAAAHLDRLNELNPTFLIAQPSLLLELAKMKQANQLSIQPSKIISVAEVLYPEDQAFLESVFGQCIHQVYQCTEGLLATSCVHGTLHFNEDFLIIEKKYVDDEHERFHPVITDLLRSSQPVIRYELNDLVIEKKKCPCGSPFMGIEKIEGRSDDVLSFMAHDQKEVRIFPDFFRRAIIMSDERIQDYTLVQTKDDELELYSDYEEGWERAQQAIHQLLTEKNIKGVVINRVVKKRFENGNKLRRIQNENRKAS